MAHSTFGERFAYAVFLFHMEHGYAPGNAQIGKAIGRKGQAVTLWAVRKNPPPDYRDGKPLHAPLASFFGVDEAWLIDGVGDPPHAELWTGWLRLRREQHVKAEPRPTAAPTKSGAVASKGGRKRRAG